MILFGRALQKNETVPLIIAIIIDCVIVPAIFFALRADKFEGRWICRSVEITNINLPSEMYGEYIELVFDGHGKVLLIDGNKSYVAEYDYSGDKLTIKSKDKRILHLEKMKSS